MEMPIYYPFFRVRRLGALPVVLVQLGGMHKRGPGGLVQGGQGLCANIMVIVLDGGSNGVVSSG